MVTDAAGWRERGAVTFGVGNSREVREAADNQRLRPLGNDVQYSPMEPQISPPRRVHGVDFSGAQNAGKLIWVASCVIDGDSLRVEDCRPAVELPRSGRDLGRALSALKDFIAASRDCAIGLDFPFGLPRQVIQETSWKGFIDSFAHRHSGPGEFQQACVDAALKATGRKELKRLTDKESSTPFSPYNRRIYRQTYFGIHDVLAPLVRSEQACVLPMQTPEVGKPWVLEVCPASTLKGEGLPLSFKSGKQEHLASRHRILQALESATPLSISNAARSRVLENNGGDALDSVIAARAVFLALPNLSCLGRNRPEYAVEGYVYV